VSVYINSYSKPFIVTQKGDRFSSRTVGNVQQPTIKNVSQHYKNYDFTKYQLLRDRIINKIHEVITTFDDPRSSINSALTHLMRKNKNNDRQDFEYLIDTINQYADNLLTTDNTDVSEYFRHMNNFTNAMRTLSKKLEYYIYKTDSIDQFDVREPIETLRRLHRDFKELKKAEHNFPPEFRQHYVDKFQEKDFF